MATDTQHHRSMQPCLALAKAARQAGNIPVAALIVRDNTVIATACETLPTQLDVTGHAELIAVRRACQVLGTLDLRDCILSTTAEPGWMCAYAIRETRLKMVVIGAATPEVGAVSSRYPLLTDDSIVGWAEPPQIITGILQDEWASVRAGPAKDKE